MAALKKSAPKGAEGQGLPPPANWIDPSLAAFAAGVNIPKSGVEIAEGLHAS
jgi:hypothetical protein